MSEEAFSGCSQTAGNNVSSNSGDYFEVNKEDKLTTVTDSTDSVLVIEEEVKVQEEEMETVVLPEPKLCPPQLDPKVTLAVGPEGNTVEFKVHIKDLVRNSPVLRDILEDMPDTSNDPIRLDDVSPWGFGIFVKFLSNLEISLSNIDELEEVWVVARKYKIDAVTNFCRSMWKTFVTPSTTCRMYALATQWGEDSLSWECLDIFEMDTLEVINSNGFLNATLETLASLLLSPQLTLQSEGQLFTALVRWGKEECHRLGLKPNPCSLRKVLKPLFPFVRFLDMTPEEFVKLVVTERILTESEERAVIINLVTRMEITVPIPESLSGIRKSRLVKGRTHVTIANIKTLSKSANDGFSAPQSPNSMVNNTEEKDSEPEPEESSCLVEAGTTFQLIVEVIKGLIQIDEMSLSIFDEQNEDPISLTVMATIENVLSGSRHTTGFATSIGSTIRRLDCYSMQIKAGERAHITVECLEDCRSRKNIATVDLPHSEKCGETEFMVRKNRGPNDLCIHRIYYFYK